MKKTLFLSLLALVLFGCEGSPENDSSQSESLGYSFELNGCKTGEHHASSLKGYCENLSNHSLNNYCATRMRKQEFERECSGQGVTWNSFAFSEGEPIQ